MKLFLNNKYIVENYSVNSEPVQLNEIEELLNELDDNISKEVKIPSDVLNSFRIKENLNPELWDGDKLKSDIKKTLNKIANDFFETLKLPKSVKILDILFTGSLANYNWSKYSDIDLHILIDFSKLNGNKDFVKNSFDSQKNMWNLKHDVTIHDYDVELYVQDIKEKLMATAVYSIVNDEWLEKPERENIKINKKEIKQKAEFFIDKLNTIKKEYDDDNFKKCISDIDKLKEKLKNFRKSGLEKGGEYSIENIVYKTLRRSNFLEIIDTYKAKSYDKLMSIKESIKNKLKTIA
jgi:predicted nucleotidyltransferase